MPGEPCPELVKRADGSWLVGGQVLIGDLNHHFGRTLIDEEETGYATIAGYFMGRMDRIPKAGDVVSADGFTAEVLDMDGNRIDKVLITLKEE